jgi:hypothetical protein
MKAARVSRGLSAGFSAAAALVLWSFLVDVVRGQPLITPAYVSGLIFSFTTALPATARLVASALIIFVVLAVVSILVAAVLEKLRIQPRLYLGVVVGVMLFAAVFLVSDAVYGVNLVRALGWLQVLGGSIVAGVVMLAYWKLKRVEF